MTYAKFARGRAGLPVDTSWFKRKCWYCGIQSTDVVRGQCKDRLACEYRHRRRAEAA